MAKGKPLVEDLTQLNLEGQFRYYAPLAMVFVALFIVVNIVAQKIVPLGAMVLLTAGDFIYPLLYLVSILLTEVYGYTMSRRVIWSAFGCNLLVAFIVALSIALPSAAFWQDQEAFQSILGRTPRLLVASLGAFLVGEFLGTYVLAKIKVFTQGRYFWFRAASATLLGQLIDSFVFTTVAFYGLFSLHKIFILAVSAYGCKIIYQVFLTPLIYPLANFLKHTEGIDIFDRRTNFNPFNLRLK